MRSAITWVKLNPMPESVNDRPTSAYEMVFLLTKHGPDIITMLKPFGNLMQRRLSMINAATATGIGMIGDSPGRLQTAGPI